MILTAHSELDKRCLDFDVSIVRIGDQEPLIDALQRLSGSFVDNSSKLEEITNAVLRESIDALSAKVDSQHTRIDLLTMFDAIVASEECGITLVSLKVRCRQMAGRGGARGKAILTIHRLHLLLAS